MTPITIFMIENVVLQGYNWDNEKVSIDTII